MAKIAFELEQAVAQRAALGIPGGSTSRVMARGEGWKVADVLCTSGPDDRPFEEQHQRYAIAVVLAGTFQYRSPLGEGLMTPGSLMLGNRGHSYECGHEHGHGDRCLAFWYEPEWLERLAADAGVKSGLPFRVPRLPALQPLSPLIARAAANAMGTDAPWEELAVDLAARAIQLASGVAPDGERFTPAVTSRVTRAVRAIDRHPGASLTLGRLARHAGLSPYHFLRTFRRLTGLTPHQYVLRARLREAAIRLTGPGKVLDIALDCGFGDVSNFNHAFRREFGLSPRAFLRSPWLRR